VRKISKRQTLVIVILSLSFLLILGSPVLVQAWGEKGHKIINQVAAEKMPADTPEFFRKAVDRLTYLGPEPDRWRDRRNEMEPALDELNKPEHFIDMDKAENFRDLPDDRYLYEEWLRQQGKDVKVIGLLPYSIMENFQKIRINFRLWRQSTNPAEKAQIEHNIITFAGIMGHYVGDGSMPLHTSDKFDGWRGTNNPNGYSRDTTIHGRFEGQFVDGQIKIEDVRDQVNAPLRLKDPFADIVTYLTKTNTYVDDLYKMDLAHKFDRDQTDPAAKKFVSERLAAGSQMLANLWYTAWVDSVVTETPNRQRNGQ